MLPLAPEATGLYRFLQRLIQLLALLLTRPEISGQEHIPATGSFILASNHLHVLDLPFVFASTPRQLVVFAADKWRGKFNGWLMRFVTKTIFVARGEVDRRALGEALATLKSGAALAIAPEGTRSRTGGLLKGRSGATYLASRAAVPIIPLVVWGQEQVMPGWLRLRRTRVHVRFGSAINLPPEAATAHTTELAVYTDQLMLTMARMLPPDYRGIYKERD